MVQNRTICLYNVRCVTEDTWVQEWRDENDPPTQCPNDHSHEVDQNYLTSIDSITENAVHLTNLPLTPFDRVLTSEESTVISIVPGMGVSKLRDVVVTEGDGYVQNAVGDSEYVLTATTPGSKVMLQTAERGRYVAGLASEVGIGGHLLAPLEADQSLKFGAFDDNDGFYFEITGPNLYVVVKKDGVETRIARPNFNVDSLDGNGPSKVIINPFIGYVWSIRYAWYGFGIVEFAIVSRDIANEQHIVPLHRYYSDSRVSVSRPNLPISILLDAGGSNKLCGAYITGRKYAVLGKFDPMTRAGSAYMIKTIPSPAHDLTPLMSIRRKAGYLSAPVTLDSLEAYAELKTVMVQIRTGMTLTGAQWGTHPDAVAQETAVEYDESATAASGGIMVYQGFARPGAAPALTEAIDFYLTERDAITVLVRNAGVAGELNLGLRYKEEW